MFYTQNLHTHGVLCDGKNEYEDTVQKAMECGLTSLGFSGHSYTEYSKGAYCMTEEKTLLYKKEINRLKVKYKDQLEIFCGLEFDQYSTDDKKGYDYIIGTLHYFKFGNEFVTFDRSADWVKQVIDDYFNGDGLKYAKEYYRQFAELPKYGKFDLVGHFDLITKHSETHDFFNTNSPSFHGFLI